MRYNEPALCVEQHVLGQDSKTRVTVMYDAERVNPQVLEKPSEYLAKRSLNRCGRRASS